MTGTRPILPANLQPVSSSSYPQQQQQQQQEQHYHPGEGPSASQGGGGGAGNPGGPGKTQYSKRGKITIVACVPCRRRKTKCDGRRPQCTQCTSRESQCHYDMTDDQRKLTFLRDNVEHLQEKSSVLESLFNTIQTANDEEAAEIFRRLRTDNDIQHVAEQIQAGRLLSGVGRRESDVAQVSQVIGSIHSATDPDLTRARQYDILMQQLAEATPHDSSDVLRRIRGGEDVETILEAIKSGRLSPLRLVRSSPDKVQATLEGDYSRQEQTFGIVKGTSLDRTHANAVRSEFSETRIGGRWTDVTQDMELVDDLLALYFTWQHSFFQNFPEDLFRSDFEHGRTKYCSSMLVNAICAAGCFLSDLEQLRKHDSQPERLSDRFYDTAVKQLDANKGSCVTTTAALYLISYVEGTRGMLSNLWMYSGRSTLMAIDIDLHLKRAYRPVEDPEKRKEMARERRARCHAFWGAFHVDQITSFTLGRMPNINARGVTQDPPPIDEDDDKQLWSAPDIGTSPRRPSAKSSTFAYCASLSKIVNGTLLMFFAPPVPLSGTLLIDEYEKYLEWKNTLPSNLKDTDNSPPHVLCLHMYYWLALLQLFRPFLKATIDNSAVVPREVCRLAANTISELMAEHMRQYQKRGIYMFQVQCLLSACTIHIINIPSIQATRKFTEACNMFQDLLPRNEWARSCLGILRNLVDKWKLILPLEAEEALCRDQYPQPTVPRAEQSDELPKLVHATDPSSVFEDSRDVQGEPDGRLGEHRRSRVDEDRQQPALPSKRSSSSANSGNVSSSPAGKPAIIPQKRQRIMAPHVPAETPTQLMDDDDGDASGRKKAPAQPIAENFLYSPLAGQPAPLLTPVQPMKPGVAPGASSHDRQILHATWSAQEGGLRPNAAVGVAASAQTDRDRSPNNLSLRGRMQNPSQQRQQQHPLLRGKEQSDAPEEMSDVEQPNLSSVVAAQSRQVAASASTLESSPHQQQRQQHQQNQQQQTPAEITNRQQQQQQQQQQSDASKHRGIEGLSFDDDWRDPFMGFLGHQEE